MSFFSTPYITRTISSNVHSTQVSELGLATPCAYPNFIDYVLRNYSQEKHTHNTLLWNPIEVFENNKKQGRETTYRQQSSYQMLVLLW